MEKNLEERKRRCIVASARNAWSSHMPFTINPVALDEVLDIVIGAFKCAVIVDYPAMDGKCNLYPI